MQNKPRYQPWGWLLIGAVLLSTLGAAAADQPSPRTAPDTEYRNQIVGIWKDEYQGQRTMTVRADGTATMVVQLHGWKATLYTPSLRFEMIWSIHAGYLKKQTTGGEPAGKVKTILKMMGDKTTERILELDRDQLLLLDQNGKRKYDWRRVPQPSDPRSH